MMTHQEALRGMLVEQYMLGELAGEVRERFEQHLFDCELCAADLKAGVTMMEATRAELIHESRPGPATLPVRGRRWSSALRPAWMVPALAASLLAFAYQTLVRVPQLEQQVADARVPSFVSSVVLTGGATRAETMPHVEAPSNGSFLLAVDIPAQPLYAGYVCTLFSPSGGVVWHGSVTAAQARDTVEIRVPSAATSAGVNTLLIQGQSQPGTDGAKLVDLARRSFVFEAGK